MGTFDSFTDTPFLIQTEGQEITLKFERTTNGTGLVSWNIPSPAIGGCSIDKQAYNGIVITVDNEPYKIESAPQNGLKYVSDPSSDRDLHAGDKIGTSLVVGSFYDDKTTTSLNLTGLDPNKPYYVSGYAVDDQFRYHTQGVHAYSLNYGTPKEPDTAASQTIIFNSGNGILPTDGTQLDPSTTYTFDINIDGQDYTIKFVGADALTYQDLIDTINNAIKKLSASIESPVPPNTGTYYWDAENQALFQWDGTQYLAIDVIVEPTDPASPMVGSYWYKTDTDELFVWGGTSPYSWIPVTDVIKFYKDPTTIDCGDYWYQPGSPSTAWAWDGTTWCELVLFEQETDPALAPTPDCGAYWYNTDSGIVNEWDSKTETWADRTSDVIYWNTNPNNLPEGTYWFDSTNEKLYIRALTGSPPMLPLEWIELSESNACMAPVIISSDEPSPPIAGMFWFSLDEDKLYKRSSTNASWMETPVLIYFTDPTERQSCDIWWDSDGAPDDFFKWDANNLMWVKVSSFTQNNLDPAVDPVMTEGMVWYDPSTQLFKIWTGTGWEEVNYVNRPTDPRIVTLGDVWYDTTTGSWYEWDGTAWVSFDPTDSNIDPTLLPLDSFWYDTTNNLLYTWNGVNWIPVSFTTTPPEPLKGTLWYNTTTNQLLMWDGTSWVETTGLAEFIIDENGNIVVTSSTVGSSSYVYISTVSEFWTQILNGVVNQTICGEDGNEGIPSYAQVGVGTDGSVDERRELMNSIMAQLGYPTVQVELTKYQLDTAITSAIEELRRRSGNAFERGFLLLDIKPGIQRYALTNKARGYNQIAGVTALARMTSAFLTSAHGSGVFGQVVLQHLYTMGTYDLLSFHMVTEYVNQLEHLFASRLPFTFNERSRILTIHSSFSQPERVLMDVAVERTEQDLLTDRYTKVWIERFALSTAYIELARVRGKYASVPGAGGGISLDAAQLQDYGERLREQLWAELDDYTTNNMEEWGIGAQFTWG